MVDFNKIQFFENLEVYTVKKIETYNCAFKSDYKIRYKK